MRRRLVGMLVTLFALGGLLGVPPSASAVSLAPANDDFANATDITSLPFTEQSTQLTATDEAGEPRACRQIGNAVWYRFSPGSNSVIRVALTYTRPTRVVAVYRGTSLGSLGTVGCTTSELHFAAEAGETYYMQLGGDSGEKGAGTLSMSSTTGIAGRVVDHLNSPIRQLCVDASGDQDWDYTSTRAATFDHPAADGIDGSYVLLVRAGSYRVSFGCWDSDYIHEYYNDKQQWSEAELVEVPLDGATFGIDAELEPASRIQGTLTDDAGQPVQFDCVQSFDLNGSMTGWDYVSSDGTYDLAVLPGTHKIEFGCYDRRYRPEFFNDKPDFDSADALTVGPRETISGIDAVLARRSHISGRVLESGTGDGIDYACVDLIDATDGTVVDSDWTFWGYYDLWAEPGSYKVRYACEVSDYIREFYRDKPDLDSADIVTVGTEWLELDDVSLDRLPPPANDAVSNAQALEPAPGSFSGTTRSASWEVGEARPCSSGGRSVWFSYTPSSTQDIFFKPGDGTFSGAVNLAVFLPSNTSATDAQLGSLVACKRSSTRTGFHAQAGKTYLIQVSSYYAADFTIEMVLGSSGSTTTFEAASSCALLCPYWNQTRSRDADNEATCAPTPDSPEGSWDEREVTVPSPESGPVPTQLLFHIEPELDFDAWVCRKEPDAHGRYYVTHAANLMADPCPTAYAFGCVENATVPVQPGETYILRVYNWSDKGTSPGGWSFLYEELPAAPTPIFVEKTI